MASIRNRDGRWQAAVRRRGFPSISKTFHRRVDAERWAKCIEVEVERATYKPVADEAEVVTFGALLKRYAAEVCPTKRSGDKEAYLLGRVLIDLEALQDREARAVRPSDMAAVRDAWLAEGYAPASVVRRLGLVGHCYEMAAKEWGHVGLANPVRAIRMPRLANARSRLITDEEIDRIIAITESPELPALVLLLADTAMRRGEALGLVRHRVDFERRVARLEITKSGRPRDVPLSPRAVALLRSLTPQADGRFFTINGCTASGAWRRAVERARENYEDECACLGTDPDPRFLVGCNLHDLRHTRLTFLASAGLSPVQLMGISGHVTLNQLARYSHVQTSHLIERLDAIEAASAVPARHVVDIAMQASAEAPAALAALEAATNSLVSEQSEVL